MDTTGERAVAIHTPPSHHITCSITYKNLDYRIIQVKSVGLLTQHILDIFSRMPIIKRSTGNNNLLPPPGGVDKLGIYTKVILLSFRCPHVSSCSITYSHVPPNMLSAALLDNLPLFLDFFGITVPTLHLDPCIQILDQPLEPGAASHGEWLSIMNHKILQIAMKPFLYWVRLLVTREII